MATFESVWHEVRKSIGDRDDLDTEVQKAVNEATQDIAAMFRIRNVVFSTSTVTVLGIPGITLPVTVYDVISVRNDDDEVLLYPGDIEEYNNLARSASSDWGTPTKWLVEGTELITYNPVADSAVNITYRYVYRIPNLTGTLSFPLPREWERPTKLLAKSYMFEIIGQSQEAIAAYQQAMAVAGGRHNDKYFRDIYNKSATANFGSPVSEEY